MGPDGGGGAGRLGTSAGAELATGEATVELRPGLDSFDRSAG